MKKNNVYVFSAPDTYLGPAFEKAQQIISSNKIGKIILNNDDYLELKETFKKKYPKEDFKKLQFYENYLLK